MTVFLACIASFALGFGMCLLTFFAGASHDAIYQSNRKNKALQTTKQNFVECSGCGLKRHGDIDPTAEWKCARCE